MQSLSLLLKIYKNSNKAVEEEEVLNEMLTIEKTLGKKGSTGYNLAELYFKQGRCHDAVRMIDEFLKSNSKHKGAISLRNIIKSTSKITDFLNATASQDSGSINLEQETSDEKDHRFSNREMEMSESSEQLSVGSPEGNGGIKISNTFSEKNPDNDFIEINSTQNVLSIDANGEKIMLTQEINAIEVFKKYTNSEGAWEEIKKNHLNPLNENAEKLSQELGALIKFRDIIDFRIYCKAVERLFPPQYYNLDTRINGVRANQDVHPRFTASWYELIVTKRAENPSSPKSNASCVIKVNAPGSRNLTSDIDTSIFTFIEGNAEALVENAHERVKAHGPDYAGRITNGVIDGFYIISESEFGMASAEHRDSNVYVDLSTNENEEYPKFKERNVMIAGKPLFNKDELDNEIRAWKTKKHQLELAASLFSLRVALGIDKWKGFIKRIDVSRKACGDTLEDGKLAGKDRAKLYMESAEKDMVEVFKITEELFTNYEKEITKKKQEINYTSRLEGEAKRRDTEIVALNRLYVEYLEKMTTLNGEILSLKAQNKNILNQIEPISQALNNEEEKLRHLKEKPDLFESIIKETERKISEQRKDQELKTKILKDNHIKLANLELKKLQMRYQAHTFASEGYVGRSAVYHVVIGMQQGNAAIMTEQTLLCSALEQIGFKLLHSQGLGKRGGKSGEVAYKTAKYGQRVHHLLFKESKIEDEQIRAVFKNLRYYFEMFFRLKSEVIKSSLLRVFALEELLLLNLHSKIVNTIKNNPKIPEQEKYKETEKFLNNEPRYNEEDVFLSIAAKLMAVIYLSKFERKTGLWGEVSIKPLVIPQFNLAQELQPSLYNDNPNVSQDRDSQMQEAAGSVTRLSKNQFKRKLEVNTENRASKQAKTDLEGNTVEGETIIKTTTTNSVNP